MDCGSKAGYFLRGTRLPARLTAALMALSLCACSPRLLIVQSAADELASQGQAEEEDLVLAREASAFYLKLSESILRESPGHLKLAESLAAGFTRYAYAFVAFEADRIESKDAKAAQKLRERAARLYLRAHRHAMAALELHAPGFAAKLASPDAAQWPRLDTTEVGLAYWAAASWGAFIALSKDNPDAVADLPLAARLARLAWERDPHHGDGALATLMGSFESARPGGDRRQAERYFDQAIENSRDHRAGACVAKAEAIALPAADRPAFEALLRQALQASARSRDVSNEVMRERAQWLLDTADDLF